jgi:hypothetical protein
MAKRKSAGKAAKTRQPAPRKRATGAVRRRDDGTMTFHYGRKA